MALGLDDKVTSRNSAKNLLEKCKKYESEHQLHEKQIGKIVIRCKNEEQFEEFEKAISNPKMW